MIMKVIFNFITKLKRKQFGVRTGRAMRVNISAALQRLVFAVLVGAAIFCQARAQSATPQSLIMGRVLDPDRAAIAGAQIVASPRNRSPSSSALSNRTGEFSLA